MPYLNIETQLAEPPDQNLLSKLGMGTGNPALVFIDHKGLALTTGDLTKQDEFQRSLEDARWAFAIYLAAEKKKQDSVAQANAKLLDLYLARPALPLAELETAAATRGADAKLVAHFRGYVVRIPVLEALRDFEEVSSEANRKASAKKMYAVYRDGKSIDDPADKLFVRYWTMAFDGAILEKDKAGARKVLDSFSKIVESGGKSMHRFLRDRMKKDLENLR
ncbi:MAG: hypothetical protein L0Z55_12155 [Planctomycetes bacterium]|nr:hypothetical protein [Planctomycetota bacterium]